MGVAQTATVVSETGLVGPHWAPRESVPGIESRTIRAGQPIGPGDSKDSTCSRTDTEGQVMRVLRCPNLRVIVEVHEYVSPAASCLTPCPLAVSRLVAVRPSDGPAGPCVQGWGVVAAGIEFLGTMQAAVNEVGGHIHQTRPCHGIG